MRTRILISLTLFSLLGVLGAGCSSTPPAAAPPAAGQQTTGKGGAPGSGASVGLNPDYKGPADGGVGSKSPPR